MPRRSAAGSEVSRWPDTVSDAAALRVFVAVARLGAVGRAAEALGRTQPSVSARLAALESGWGTRLFHRRARGMAPTPEGAKLLPLAEAALAAIDAVDRAAGGAAEVSEIRVGSGDALGRELLPRALRGLLRREPALRVRVIEGPGARLLDLLESGALDVAFVVMGDGLRRDGIRLDGLLSSPVDALFPPTEAPRQSRVDIVALAGRGIVTLQQGSWFRRHVESAAASRGVVLRAAVEVGNLSLVRRFVAAGLGAGLVPAIAFRRRAPGPRVERRAVDGVAPVVYGAAEREGAPQRPAVRRLIERLRAEHAAAGSR